MIHDVIKLNRVWILSCKFSFDRMNVDNIDENSEVEKNKVALSILFVNLPNQQNPAQPSQWLPNSHKLQPEMLFLSEGKAEEKGMLGAQNLIVTSPNGHGRISRCRCTKCCPWPCMPC